MRPLKNWLNVKKSLKLNQIALAGLRSCWATLATCHRAPPLARDSRFAFLAFLLDGVFVIIMDVTKTECNNRFIIHWTKKTNGSHVFASSPTTSNKKRANLARFTVENHAPRSYMTLPPVTLSVLDMIIVQSIGSNDVTEADFEKSLCAFRQSEKRESSMYNNAL